MGDEVLLLVTVERVYLDTSSPISYFQQPFSYLRLIKYIELRTQGLECNVPFRPREISNKK